MKRGAAHQEDAHHAEGGDDEREDRKKEETIARGRLRGRRRRGNGPRPTGTVIEIRRLDRSPHRSRLDRRRGRRFIPRPRFVPRSRRRHRNRFRAPRFRDGAADRLHGRRPRRRGRRRHVGLDVRRGRRRLGAVGLGRHRRRPRARGLGAGRKSLKRRTAFRLRRRRRDRLPARGARPRHAHHLPRHAQRDRTARTTESVNVGLHDRGPVASPPPDRPPQ